MLKKILLIMLSLILSSRLVGFDEDEIEKYNLSISKEGEGKIYFEEKKVNTRQEKK